MKLPPLLTSWKGRFERCSLRERLFILAAALVLLVGGGDMMLIDPVDAHRKALLQEVTALDSQNRLNDEGVAATLAADPTSAATARVAALQAQLQAVDSQLLAQSAGMITPEHMVEVIHDVLGAQPAVVLVSLHNLPPMQLPADQEGEAAPEGTRPYLHRVELVLEGPYLNVLEYLATLERLPWHFYWRRLELTSAKYPANQVRVEIGTISPERDWIGL